MTSLYRFSFETDEQYNARVHELLPGTQTDGQELTQATSVQDHPRSTFQLLLPGWVIGLIVVAILVVAFRAHRQKLAREERQRLKTLPKRTTIE